MGNGIIYQNEKVLYEHLSNNTLKKNNTITFEPKIEEIWINGMKFKVNPSNSNLTTHNKRICLYIDID